MTKKVIENFGDEIGIFLKEGHSEIFCWTTPKPAFALDGHGHNTMKR